VLSGRDQGESGKSRRYVGKGSGDASMNEADLLLVNLTKINFCHHKTRLNRC
jgi:hypothetical protein